MVEPAEAVFAVVLVLVVLWALHRLSVIGNATLTLWKTPVDTEVKFEDEQQIAIEGEVVVDEPAHVAERLFDPAERPVGAYVWHAWTPDTGRNVYDFDDGEPQGGQSTFASGVETGQAAITTHGHQFNITFDWLHDTYDPDTLSGLTVGNPMSYARVPTVMTRYLSDSIYISLESAVGECRINRLRDIINVHDGDVSTEEFNIEARGIAAGQQLFVTGELQERDGVYSVRGTDQTPLLVSDTGREGLIKQLRWRAVKYVLALLGATGLLMMFVL